jgi:acetyl esterase/lipase
VDADDVLTRQAGLPDAVLRYGPHAEGTIDLHLPPGADGDPHDLVFLVHGGFWRQTYDRVHTRPMAEALCSKGFLVATPEYRRVGTAELPGSGGWPTTGQDVDRARAALPTLLADLGIRVRRTIASGHSAGGHLVLWLANQPHRVDRVVALAPVGDLRAAAMNRVGRGAVQALLGGDPGEVPERYDEADPATRFVRRPRADIVVVHGAADDVVPVRNSRCLAAAHRWVELRELDGVGHFELIDPLSSAWPAVLAALDES